MARYEDLCLDDVLLWAEGLKPHELRHTIAWLEKVLGNTAYGYSKDKELTKMREKMMEEAFENLDEGWVPERWDPIPHSVWAKLLAEIDPTEDTVADIEENLRDAFDSIKTEPQTYTLAVAKQFAWSHRAMQEDKESANE